MEENEAFDIGGRGSLTVKTECQNRGTIEWL